MLKYLPWLPIVIAVALIVFNQPEWAAVVLVFGMIFRDWLSDKVKVSNE